MLSGNVELELTRPVPPRSTAPWLPMATAECSSARPARANPRALEAGLAIAQFKIMAPAVPKAAMHKVRLLRVA